MYIEKIISHDEISDEADVLITDGKYSILCYVPEYSQKQKLMPQLSAFFVENVYLSTTKKYDVQKLDSGYYDQKFTGKVLDRKNRLVGIGQIIIKLDENIPGDIKETEYVEFTAMRVDW